MRNTVVTPPTEYHSRWPKLRGLLGVCSLSNNAMAVRGEPADEPSYQYHVRKDR